MPKVLSIKQPWASMIVRGLKRFEIRSWTTPYRGQLIIHASSAQPTKRLAEELLEDSPAITALLKKIDISSLDELRALPRSAIVGSVTLVDVFDSDAVQKLTTVDDAELLMELDDEYFYWQLRDPIEIEPIPDIDGKLNLWELDEKTHALALKRVATGTPGKFKSSKTGAKLADWSDADDGDAGYEGSEILLVPSDALAAIVGAKPLVRTEVVQKLWAYIKKHGLQDTKDRKMINADEKLLKVVGIPKINMFDMTKKVAKHLR